MAAPRCGGREPREAEGDLGLAGGGLTEMRGGTSAGGGKERNPGLGEFPGGRGWEPGAGSVRLSPRPAPPRRPPRPPAPPGAPGCSKVSGSDTRWENRRPPAGSPQARSQVKVSFPALISVSATSLGKILSNVGGIWTKMGRSLFSRSLECSSKIKPGYTLLPLKRQPVPSPQ